jgi:hypothetical protein
VTDSYGQVASFKFNKISREYEYRSGFHLTEKQMASYVVTKKELVVRRPINDSTKILETTSASVKSAAEGGQK